MFDESRKEIYVSAKLYPEDTSYKELEWSVVNDAGIVSNIAKVEEFGHEAKISAGLYDYSKGEVGN